jgi:hypothetical protein
MKSTTAFSYAKTDKEANMQEYISLISAITALTAIIIGPLVSWKIAKRQISASTITTSRQQWINNLRETISDFLAKANTVYGLAKNHYANEQSILRIEQLAQLNYKIHLLINPNEEDHSKLARLVDYISSSLNKLAKTEDIDLIHEVGDKQEELIKLSQQILKREWERVKAGEHSK